MTTWDWLGLICLAGVVGFFAGGFFVWNLFFKPPQPEEDDTDEDEPLADEPATQDEQQ
ncbi:MAG: hypothetical protein K8R36_04015 [Planctomycetales bacterium]|nr:hypothetical protein [Planctomycetales bacterium]